MLNLGRASLQVRTKPGAKCRQCKEELPVLEVYLLVRNWTIRKGKRMQFFVLLHPGCARDYIHKSWDRRPIKERGRKPGSKFAEVDPILAAIRDAKLQRRRYLLFKMKTEERPFKLWNMVEEIRAINEWLDSEGLTRDFERKRDTETVELLNQKLKIADTYGKEHPHLSAEIGS